MKRLFSVYSNTQQGYDELKENMWEVYPFYIVLMVLLGVFLCMGVGFGTVNTSSCSQLLVPADLPTQSPRYRGSLEMTNREREDSI